MSTFVFIAVESADIGCVFILENAFKKRKELIIDAVDDNLESLLYEIKIKLKHMPTNVSLCSYLCIYMRVSMYLCIYALHFVCGTSR